MEPVAFNMDNLVLQRYETTNELRFRGFYNEAGEPNDVNSSPALMWFYRSGRVETRKHYVLGLLHDTATEPAITHFSSKGVETGRQHYLHGKSVPAPHIAVLFGKTVAVYPGHGYVVVPTISNLSINNPTNK